MKRFKYTLNLIGCIATWVVALPVLSIMECSVEKGTERFFRFWNID